MDERELNRLVGRAFVDRELRERLLAKCADVLLEHGLQADLSGSLPAQEVGSLEELAGLLLSLFDGHGEQVAEYGTGSPKSLALDMETSQRGA